MPTADGSLESVHMTQLPQVNDTFLDSKLAERWEAVLLLRGEVSKALEEARNQKTIGHSLDAAVTLFLPDTFSAILRPDANELRTIFIVSRVNLSPSEGLSDAYESAKIPGLLIHVAPSPGEKCERCWIYDQSVGVDGTHKTICERCLKVLETAA
jgi:isoleucyl-tRNA synthetase